MEKRIEANAVNYLLYVFDLFYIHFNRQQRKDLISYPWDSFIPNEIKIDELDSNEYLTKNNFSLLSWILKKNEFQIGIYYKKKFSYQSLRNLKRKLIHG